MIALDPFRSLPYWIRGEIYGFQGQFEQAIADFEYLLTLQSSKIPRETDYHFAGTLAQNAGIAARLSQACRG